MAALANGSIFLDTSSFASTTSGPFTNLPIIIPNEPAINQNLSKIPIFTDDDIALPVTTNLKEFNFDLPEINQSSPPSNISTGSEINLPDSQNSGIPLATTTSSSNFDPLDFLTFDFDSVDFGESDTASSPSSDKTLEPEAETSLAESELIINNPVDSSDSSNSGIPLGTTTTSADLDPLDFLTFDFDSVDFGESDTASSPSSDKTLEPLAETNLAKSESIINSPVDSSASELGTLDFLNYDFDFNFNETEGVTDDVVPTDTTSDDGGFDLSLFQNYDFDSDLFEEEPSTGGELVEEEEEYDINDGWLDGGEDYVEKTSEEKAKEDKEFEDEWSSLVKPPRIVQLPTFKIDLMPGWLWGPPLLCLGGVFLIFVPCICVKLIDDKREKKGKQRHFGPSSSINHIHREMYEKTANGEWKRVSESDNDVHQHTNGNHQSIALNTSVTLQNAKENVLYTEENEVVTHQGELNYSRNTGKSNGALANRDFDSVSNNSNKSNNAVNISIEEGVKEVDLGDGSPKIQPKGGVVANGQTVPEGANNWSMY